jgi:hypothetical protein
MNKAAGEVDRRLPAGDEIFFDHVAHFVPDRDAAIGALARAGFAPTPVSIQVNPDPAGGAPRPSGTGNVTVMLDRGYLEILFKTADTPLSKEFDALMARYPGVRLAAFSVTDAALTHARLARSGLSIQPLVSMQRPLKTVAGDDIAAFTIVRLVPGEMPEGRIQVLTHRTEHTVWQPRWLTQPNGARGLIDLVIAQADPEEAAGRFRRYFDREIRRNRHGPAIHLDRGRVQLVAAAELPRLLPRLTVPDLPFMAGYGLGVASLGETAACLRAGGIAFDSNERCIVAPFPDDLGIGAWAFVERATDLPWRRE